LRDFVTAARCPKGAGDQKRAGKSVIWLFHPAVVAAARRMVEGDSHRTDVKHDFAGP
jgi:hypothetical protein